MAQPETRYTKAGELNIAYQVVGEGPIDLVYVPGWVSNVELGWDEPLYARFLNRLASFSRLILFDKRGTGLSDRVPRNELPALEDRIDDLKAVLSAIGSERAALLGHSEGGNFALLYAATYPDRTIAVITAGVFAKRIWSEDYPWAPTLEARAAEIEYTETNWGNPEVFRQYMPSAADDEAVLNRLGTYFRRSASPGDAAQLLRINSNIDTRDILPTIRVPTLMIHRTGDQDANVEEGRWIASRIPGAKFVEIPGNDHIPWVGDSDVILDMIQEFLTGVRGPESSDRVLSTVLFTDIVGSTSRASQIGDAEWHDTLERHDRLARSYVDQYRGRLIKSTGDGILAVFDGPARAVRCAQQLRDALAREGLAIRCGVHTGEIELRGDDVAGVAVHIAARIEGLAGPGEVLVSRTVTDLVSGSGLSFEPRGERPLEGVPGTWALAAAV
jgi:pimeloyl-ACP methyl ester carboxylesterase/class 3 adenylate cyclase